MVPVIPSSAKTRRALHCTYRQPQILDKEQSTRAQILNLNSSWVKSGKTLKKSGKISSNWIQKFKILSQFQLVSSTPNSRVTQNQLTCGPNSNGRISAPVLPEIFSESWEEMRVNLVRRRRRPVTGLEA